MNEVFHNTNEFVDSNINNFQNKNESKIRFKDHILFNIDIENNSTCPICLEDFSEGEIASILPCYHIFHRNCIEPWFKKQNSCPNCRIDNNYKTNSLTKEEIIRQIKKRKEEILFSNKKLNLDIVYKLSVKNLKFLLNEFKLDYTNCIYKEDLQNLILNEIFYLNKSTEDIKYFLKKNEVDYSQCIEKKELLKYLASIQLIKRIHY